MLQLYNYIAGMPTVQNQMHGSGDFAAKPQSFSSNTELSGPLRALGKAIGSICRQLGYATLTELVKVDLGTYLALI